MKKNFSILSGPAQPAGFRKSFRSDEPGSVCQRRVSSATSKHLPCHISDKHYRVLPTAYTAAGMKATPFYQGFSNGKASPYAHRHFTKIHSSAWNSKHIFCRL
ncbi:MAG: hypothetical protein H6557_17320 [Lewinellaceae bacterium]|nr:hypothetical protein [Lewinellaceae bacterium]